MRAKDIEQIIPSEYKTMNEFKKTLHERLIKESITKVKDALSNEDLVGIYVNYLDIMDEVINSYFERVAENFTIYYPEASIKAPDLDTFTKITKIDRKSISKLLNVDSESMGLDLAKKDIILLDASINSLRQLINQKKEIEERTKEIIVTIMPNTTKLVGEIVAARLLEAAGSLKRLMLMPSSTIQIIGAEKALFRHLRTNKRSKPPKHGIIFNTTYVTSAPLKHRGKVARTLASKISIAVKVDHFKGEPIADRLIKEMEVKMKGLK